MAAAFDVSVRTVRRAKRRYVEEGLEEVLRHHNSPTPYCKADEGKREAFVAEYAALWEECRGTGARIFFAD